MSLPSDSQSGKSSNVISCTAELSCTLDVAVWHHHVRQQEEFHLNEKRSPDESNRVLGGIHKASCSARHQHQHKCLVVFCLKETMFRFISQNNVEESQHGNVDLMDTVLKDNSTCRCARTHTLCEQTFNQHHGQRPSNWKFVSATATSLPTLAPVLTWRDRRGPCRWGEPQCEGSGPQCNVAPGGIHQSNTHSEHSCE